MIITLESGSAPLPALARFITPEAIALLLNIKVEQIKEIRLWSRVILVVAKGLTRFVSYADLPPILAAEPPKNSDLARWRKRWNKRETKQAPEFWQGFYQQKFYACADLTQLYNWGKLLGLIKIILPQQMLSNLRQEYLQAKHNLQSLSLSASGNSASSGVCYK